MSNSRELREFKKDPYELERYRNELLCSIDSKNVDLIIEKITLFLEHLDRFIGDNPDRRSKILGSIWFLIESLKIRGLI